MYFLPPSVALLYIWRIDPGFKTAMCLRLRPLLLCPPSSSSSSLAYSAFASSLALPLPLLRRVHADVADDDLLCSGIRNRI
jgi:hypothetical protein